VIELDEGFAVDQLDSVTPGEITEETAFLRQAYSRRISNATATTEILGFVKMLREQSIIEVYEDRL
jgi:hypothetical protein